MNLRSLLGKAKKFFGNALRNQKPEGISDEPSTPEPIPNYQLGYEALPPEPNVTLTELYRYQRIGVKRISKYGGRALLADEMGLGKTIQTIMWQYQHRDIATPTLIVCPAGLKENWVREFWMHTKQRCVVLEGRKPDKSILWKKPKIMIINYEIVDAWAKELKKMDIQLIALDECHRVKNMKTRCRKAIAKICPDIPYMIAISGTPLTNRPAELFSTLNLLRPEVWDSESAFMWKYTQPKMYRGRWQFTGANVKTIPELHTKLRNHCMIRRLMSDVVTDLPPMRRIVETMTLTKEGKEEYEFAEKEFAKWLMQHSSKKARRALKAEQIVRVGYLRRLAARLKVKAIKSWIDDFLIEDDGKLVVFGIHRKMIQTLNNRYADKCVVVDGSVTGKKRTLAVDRFQEDDKIRLFIGNIKAAGVGLNLTAAQTTACVELAWTPGDHAQAEKRVRRINKLQSTKHYYLIASGTIEEDLCKLIQSKQKVLDAVLDGEVVDDGIDIFDLLTKAFEKRNNL